MLMILSIIGEALETFLGVEQKVLPMGNEILTADSFLLSSTLLNFELLALASYTESSNCES